jgi:hypothetical protein
VDPLRGPHGFKNFLWLVWQHLNLPEPFPVQYEIADYLQHGPKRLIIQAFRGVGKSWITSAFVCWLLYCDPQLNILVVSASKSRADDFSTFTMRLIEEMPLLAHLRPKEGQRSSKIAFDVGPAQADHAASVKSAGITGQITGSRADVIIADDIEVPNNSETQAMREKLLHQVKEFDSIIKPGTRAASSSSARPRPRSRSTISSQEPSRPAYGLPATRTPPRPSSTLGGYPRPFREAIERDPSRAGRSTAPIALLRRRPHGA